MNANELVRILERNGWYRVHPVGKHLKYRHPEIPGYVSVPTHGKKDIPKGTLDKIEEKTGLKLH